MLAFCAIGILLSSAFLIARLQDANWWVNHTIKVIKESDEALVCLLDCETAYRGYIITGDNSYLEPYEICYKHVEHHLLTIKELTVDNANQQLLMPKLLETARAKIAFSQKMIALRKDNPALLTKSQISIEPGKRLMDEFRKTIAKVIAEENGLLIKRTRAVHNFEIGVYITVTLLELSILSAVLWLYLSTRAFAAEQLKARNETAAASAAAIRANQLKSQFVANISHEIRTPMSGVLGLTEILLLSLKDSESKELAEHIFSSAKSLLTIVNDLLDFSKLEAGRVDLNLRKFNFKSLVEDSIHSISTAAAKKQIPINVVISDSLNVECCGDPDKIRQMILNLVYNAIKFTEHGKITVAAKPLDQQQDSLLVHVQVADTGMGISLQDQQKLFEPFVQADGSNTRKHGGTGLGLSICKRLVILMGGGIGVDSKVGEGATFWFTVPLETGANTACEKIVQ
jgi:two-component system sensor histidine kinase/response regulator